MTAFSVLLLIVPFQFWHQTWFGRELQDADIDRHLTDVQHPRRIQHALTQVSERISKRDPAVKKWYSRVVDLSRHSMPEMRTTVAWVMGQDNTHAPFHSALVALLEDPDLMVRRNAALALVRFSDRSGRREILGALRPFAVRAPSAGKLSIAAQAGQEVGRGTLLARIAGPTGQPVEIRSPYAGRVQEVSAANNADVAAGDSLFLIGPDPGQAWEALRALYLVGQPEDLADVNRFGEGLEPAPGSVRQQALLTAQAIRSRSARDPTR
jgi:hypothetical protein